MAKPKRFRQGLTLVELLVVVVIITFLAALTALYFPRYQDRELVSRAADQLQGWLAGARQQAMRDGLPTGLRFYFENDGKLNGGLLFSRRIAYIQQPDDFAQGLYVGSNNNQATIILPNSITDPTSLPVSNNDYFELNGGGLPFRIFNFAFNLNGNPKTLVLTTTAQSAPLPGPAIPSPLPIYSGSPTNYRIIAQPRLSPGEQELVFSENIGIDLPRSLPMNSTIPAPPLPSPPYWEIVFGPSGALVGSSTGNAQVIFWVRDLSRDTTTDPLAGYGTLITVQPRTGFIAAHPASSGADPYEFTKDARSSGM